MFKNNTWVHINKIILIVSGKVFKNTERYELSM